MMSLLIPVALWYCYNAKINKTGLRWRNPAGAFHMSGRNQTVHGLLLHVYKSILSFKRVASSQTGSYVRR